MREVGYGQGWGAFRGRKNSRDLGELREGPAGCQKSVRKVSEYVYAGRSGRDEGSAMTQGRSELVLWTLAAPVFVRDDIPLWPHSERTRGQPCAQGRGAGLGAPEKCQVNV